MACDCKDENGSLVDRCIGMCSQYKYYEQKLIDCEAGMYKILMKFKSNLEDIERDVAEAFKDMYLDGFRKGFDMAKEIYE